MTLRRRQGSSKLQMTTKMSIDELHGFLEREFPQVAGEFRVEKLGHHSITVRRIIGRKDLRPGGSVSGPSMFGLADVAVYLAILAALGPRELAVTTSCSIDFMRKPKPCDLLAEARLLKLGLRLAVGDVLIYSEAVEPPVARASMTYSIPGVRHDSFPR